MEVGVRVEGEDPLTGVRMHTASAYTTFVALDADGRPTRVPRLRTGTPDEARRVIEAEARKAARLANKAARDARLASTTDADPRTPSR
jgi:acyl-CoA hydrolase